MADGSHPVRGAWIEMGLVAVRATANQRRTPSGVRGLKLFRRHRCYTYHSRTPSGVRGLKFV